jgi:hypothetical protein
MVEFVWRDAGGFAENITVSNTKRVFTPGRNSFSHP